MTDWTSGYVADVGYTYGYYQELNPLRTQLALLSTGWTPPDIGQALELGYGQGLSINVHATATGVEWIGTDFNPAQAGFAQELSQVASGARVLDDSFAELASRDDLPEFDYIGIHGIWSWISDENRQVMVDIIRRKLKVGGVLYISYNTLPGWSTFAPMRHLMTQHATVMGAGGQGIVNRINGAIGFADKLLETKPNYLRMHPSLPERMKRVRDHNRHYLAHEYFNRDWHPMYFADMAKWLAPAKLDYACSAAYIDHIDSINLTAAHQALLNEIPDRMFKETVRDFVNNQQFRRDYWIKGARRIGRIEQLERARQIALVLTAPRADVTFKINGSLGEATLKEEIYGPVLDALADNRPHTIGQLEAALKPKNIPFNQIIQAALALVGSGSLAPAQSESQIAQARKRTDKLNKHLMAKARSSHDIAFLACPVTGGGVQVPRFQQLFVLAINNGHKQPEDWAKWANEVLWSQGHRVVKDGKPVEKKEDNLAHLLEQAKTFAEKQLPVLKTLQVV